MNLSMEEKIKKNPFFAYEKPDGSGIEIPKLSMFGMLKVSAEAHPDAPAVDYYGARLSFAKLMEKIELTADAYHSIGVKAGDIVTILMPNTPEAVVSIYALNLLGALSNVVHPLSAEKEIASFINSVGSKVLLVIDLCGKKVSSILDETPLEKVIVVSAADGMKPMMKLGFHLTQKKAKGFDFSDKRILRWPDFARIGCRRRAEVTADGVENNAAVILHSGGTTGVPKEIRISNANFNAFAVQSVITLTDISVGDKVLAILPIFHGFGLGVCVHVTFCYGACSVLIPRFDSKNFGSLLKKYQPSMIFGVPTLFEAMIDAKGVEEMDFSFLKYAICGGDTLAKPLEKRVNDFLEEHKSTIKISEGFGMTESLAAVCLSVHDAYKSGSIGKPLIGNRFCVVKPGTQQQLAPDEDGELCICGPTVMMDYRNNPEETKNTLQTHSDGRLWLHTGDIVSIDADGFVWYKLRLKRMIISSGYNIYPHHIEKVIEDYPAVFKCVVVGIPHPYKKEVAKAYIVLKKGFELDEETRRGIKQHCIDHLAHFSIPYEFEYRQSLPKTLLGKTDFNKLKEENLQKEVSA